MPMTINKIYEITCDEPDCPARLLIHATETDVAIASARGAGWVVTKDKKRFYCPAHAIQHPKGKPRNPARSDLE